ncbi:MAG: HD domain-containing protein [Treponema sp.]|jgi:poly(A) polymerase|nr:HD domain-containing protein [Treponema sp.]
MGSNRNTIYKTLAAQGHSLSLCSFSVLDRYWGLPPLPFVWAETDADISDLARLFEGLYFPGVDLADAAVEDEQRCWYFRCPDLEGKFPWPSQEGPSYKLLTVTQDQTTETFHDPLGMYPLLRRLRYGKPPTIQHPVIPPDASSSAWTDPWWAGLNPKTNRWRAAMDGSLILARYSPADDAQEEDSSHVFAELTASLRDLRAGQPPLAEGQRVLLTGLLVSGRPDLGLGFLKAAGFVEEFWPELARFDKVDHSKEFHPEGNVWDHTLETFRYRKAAPWDVGGEPPPRRTKLPAYDLRLSLGLLLHDVGKPLAVASGNRRFDGHAELGAREARRFLERLGFESSLISDVFYLVKNHMLPAALPRLPLSRTEEIMGSPLFSTLMELYRCDESSSFKGMAGYYKSSAVYQTYLRHQRNPYRSTDGKILGTRRMGKS